MPLYRITWQIDLAADSPKHAAQQALAIQRDTHSWATVFTVESNYGPCTRDVVDLQFDENEGEKV